MPDETPVGRPDRVQLRVATSSGKVTITAEVRNDVEIASGHTAERQPASPGGVIDVQRKDNVEIRCPVGADVVVGTSSGRVQLRGELGDVRVTSQSGRISAEAVASADMRTKSGRIEVDRCGGVCRVSTTSGSVRVGRAADVDIRGVSSKVEASAGRARIRTVSGGVGVDSDGDAAVETVSGNIDVALPPGVRPHVDAHGLQHVNVQVPEGQDCELSMRSVSGRVTVRSR